MSYSLRTVLASGIQENELIGKRFQVIFKERNPEEFANWMEKVNVPVCEDDCFALVVSSSVAIPLNKSNMHYIVDNRGVTFQSIQHKTDRQNFNRTELVIFGNYLLSEERDNLVEFDKNMVNHADVENFIEKLVN